MPADTRQTAAARRNYKLPTEAELEIRRARGEISCAECRRLKLKCDKKIPCSSCVRRGCPSVCPNGSLTSGQGTRFVLADTQQLHQKIAEMGQRIRQLEDALAIFQSGVSTETHPLLREELLAVKFAPEVQRSDKPETPPRDDALIESMNALGTLTIDEGGASTYFGRSAGTESLFLVGAELEAEDVERETASETPLELLRLDSILPFSIGRAPDCDKFDDVMNLLFSCLPHRTRASTLCETYMEQAAWLFRPINRDEIIDDILTPIYNAKRERDDPSCEENTHIQPHKLAVLFMIFALGALVDLTLPPSNKEGNIYHHYARAALSLRPILETPAIETVQVIVLMAYYHSNSGKRYTQDSVWILLSVAGKLAQSIGLHRDPARWNMDEKTVERRRRLFWELHSAEMFHSLVLGRPASIQLSYIDCEFPKDENELDSQYWHWKYRFAKDVFSSVIESTLAVTPPGYDTILELDRKVREKALPEPLNVFVTRADFVTPSQFMRGCLLSQYHSVTILYIHRSFFAQALLEYPANPLCSPYAPSFLAAYRCASIIIKSTLHHVQKHPQLFMRWWNIWTHLFSAAVIVGSVATRAPSSPMASAAFIELGLAVDLFEKGAKFSCRARSGGAILSKMKEKAVLAFSQLRNGAISPITPSHVPHEPEDGTDELAIFGGQTRILVSKFLSAGSPTGGRKKGATRGSPSSESLSPVTPSSNYPAAIGSDAASLIPSKPGDMDMQDVHPSLIEFMSLLPSLELSPSINIHPDFNSQSYSLDHSSSNEVSTFPQSTTSLESSNFLYAQNDSTGTSSQQNGFGYDPMSFYDYQPPSTSITPTSSSTFETAGPDDPTDLGMMVNGNGLIDEQWMSFMRDSGILYSYPSNISA